MKILIGSLVLVVWCADNILATSIAAPSCPCPRILRPVCGSDNVTYANECIFNCTRDYYCEIGRKPIFIDYKGACREPCICTEQYAPVCGSDGQTYSNQCNLNCKNQELRNNNNHTEITIAYKGKCTTPCVCTLEYAPVCGSDGQTYSNQCNLNCKNQELRNNNNHTEITIAYKGKCTTPCVCTLEYAPVCGSDGQTYSNQCNLNCKNQELRNNNNHTEITIAYKGKCTTACVCTLEYAPVCGSDGQTYSNQCNLNCKNQELRNNNNHTEITIAYKGKCTTPCVCTLEYAPVCGSDGQTYSNQCNLNCKNQELRNNNNHTEITIVYKGKCTTPCVCTLEYAPVCGSDGQTYSNQCNLNCKNQELRNNNNHTEITIAYKGKCTTPCVCTLEYAPVCGSDGITYGNNCSLNCENQRKAENGEKFIQLINTGECNKSCICAQIFKPVCGSDGKTYPNKCQCECQNQGRSKEDRLTCSEGACSEPTICYLTNQPVCGSNNVTYTNDCFLKAASRENINKRLPPIEIKSPGECPTSCGCPNIYKPVCGNDGNTYSSKCDLSCKNKQLNSPITITSEGECPDTCICPAVVLPVCGSDGKTYPNECQLNCESRRRKPKGQPPISVIYSDGECPASCTYPGVYQPVCGSDSKTYSNQCQFDIENRKRSNNGQEPLTINYEGECVVPCPCTRQYDPVCGDDGRTYSNKCLLDCENKKRNATCCLRQRMINVASQGVCPEPAICNLIYQLIYQPVCGSNDVTYSNECFLNVASEESVNRSGSAITLQYRGECVECRCPFYFVYQPVCGSDGKTYVSACELNCENIRREKRCQSPLTVSREGECPATCFCPAFYEPVCGCDNNTYSSLCHLGCTNRIRESQGNPPVKRQYNGECLDVTKICPLIYSPVCGTDSITYSNECFLNRTSEENVRNNLPPISIKSVGECTDESCFCRAIYQPVCGDDGITYSSSCNLECHNKELVKNGLDPIGFKDGECPALCTKCSTKFRPVCGSDGQTYYNKCELRCENEKRSKKRLRPLTITRYGECRVPCICPFIYLPVCGTDGKTYPNECSIKCTNEENKSKKLLLPEIFKASNGPCRNPGYGKR